MGGLAALALLTHCGDGETQERPAEQVGPESLSGFTGTLSATGADAWLRHLGLVSLRELVTDGSGTLTVTGYGHDYDLGGGWVSAPSSFGPTPFVARYSASSGGHLWSRSFDRDFLGGDSWPTLTWRHSRGARWWSAVISRRPSTSS